MAGTVAEADPGSDFKPGDRVMVRAFGASRSQPGGRAACRPCRRLPMPPAWHGAPCGLPDNECLSKCSCSLPCTGSEQRLPPKQRSRHILRVCGAARGPPGTHPRGCDTRWLYAMRAVWGRVVSLQRNGAKTETAAKSTSASARRPLLLACRCHRRRLRVLGWAAPCPTPPVCLAAWCTGMSDEVAAALPLVALTAYQVRRRVAPPPRVGGACRASEAEPCP